MALAMTRPFKDPKSGMWLFRQRIPLDLVVRLRGATVILPIGEQQVTVKIGDLVQASLRTKDRATVEARHVAADAALKAFWDTRVPSRDCWGPMGVVRAYGYWSFY